MYADLAVLSQDYFSVPEEAIKDITSVLTLLGGKAVYAAEEFSHLDQNKDLPVSPDWSPVRYYQGYCNSCSCQKKSLDVLLGNSCKESLNPWVFGCDCFTY